MTRAGPTGIVLAGGRSSRFGADKLGELVGSEPLLWRPIRALAGAGCAEIVVTIATDAVAPAMPPELLPLIRFVRDPEPDHGPLLGLRTGLAEAPGGVAIVVAGDQPSLRPALLRSMTRAFAAPVQPGGREPRALALVDPDGVVRPLPCLVDRDAALMAADRLLGDGEGRLRALLGTLDAREMTEPAWRRDDPDAGWTIDIDVPGDLHDARRGGGPLSGGPPSGRPPSGG